MRSRWMWTVVAAASAGLLPWSNGVAQERSGKEVVESTCAACHAKGLKGAPKIGDKKAWAKRTGGGVSVLTQTALKGIRNMPSHGGNAGLSDLEVARGVTYMVNKSGGHWVEPASLSDLAAERTGKQVVAEQCVKCHGSGKGGAPKIGDLKAWTPRLKDGLDNTVKTALHGHGGMPARGNRADLTDNEVRNAVLYMIDPKNAKAPKATKSK